MISKLTTNAVFLSVALFWPNALHATEVLNLNVEEFPIEQCITPLGEAIDISDVRFFQNRALSLNIETTSVDARLNGQDILIKSEGVVELVSVRDYLKEGQGLDIELSFVEFGHEEYLYWRETYKHRRYRSGLLTVAQDRLIHVCEGEGGISARY